MGAEDQAPFQGPNAATGSNTDDRQSVVETDNVIGQAEAEAQAQDQETKAPVQGLNPTTGSNFNNHGQGIGKTYLVIGQKEAEAQAQDQEMKAPTHHPTAATRLCINDRQSIAETDNVIGQEEAEAQAQDQETKALVQGLNAATRSNFNNHGQGIGKTYFVICQKEAKAQAQMKASTHDPTAATGLCINNRQSIGKTDNVIGDAEAEAQAQETEMEATVQALNVAKPSNIDDRPSIGKTTFVIGQEEAEAQDPEMEATVQDLNVTTGSNINNHGHSIGETDDNGFGQLEDEAQAQVQDMEAPVQGANTTRVTYTFYDAYTSPSNINPAPALDEMPQYATDTTTRTYVRYPTIENVPTNAILCGPENKYRHQEGSPNFHRGNLVYHQAIGAFWPERQACQRVKEQTTLNTRILEEIKGPFLMPCKENATKRLPPPHAPRGQEGWYYLMTFKWARNKVNQSFIDGTAERAFTSQQNNGN